MTQPLIRNDWVREGGSPFARAHILSHDVHPEGLDLDRIRFVGDGSFTPPADVPHILSVIRGSGSLGVDGPDTRPLELREGVHLYLPVDVSAVIQAKAGTELIVVSGGSASQGRGRELLVRDESFLAASSLDGHSLRWVLTPQYLSRRVFLHHDPALLSSSGDPVGWFRTTMFDVAGLPPNEEGQPVFKMSYDYQTEFNACYDVRGSARVRMARHPYRVSGQEWGPWLNLDGDSTYLLHETPGGPDEERHTHPETGVTTPVRNRHEVCIEDGYVTLFCMHDPAPTGLERHTPGEYSSYGPVSHVLGSDEYAALLARFERFERMVAQLSVAKARGDLDSLRGTPVWDTYEEGLEARASIESQLMRTLVEGGSGRERVLAPWTWPVTGSTARVQG